MIFNMVGGGANSKAFAMVLVNYPQNSTLTATNVDGYKDIFPSSSANPQRLYYVSQPSGETQTCDFTITDGTQTKSETVSGITVGMARTVTMTYTLELYNLGAENTAVTGGWTGNGYSYSQFKTQACSKETDHMLIKGWQAGGNTYGGFYGTDNLIDFTGYSTLYIDYSKASASGDGISATFISPSKTNFGSSSVYSAKVDMGQATSTTTVSIPLNGIASGYVVTAQWSTNRENLVYRIWAE